MLERLRTYGSFVRFSHSVFALPFALAGALLAVHENGPSHRPLASIIGWILLAMVAARSAAMGFNRLADARMDALNPRTANRELPRGAMTPREAALFVVVASLVFVFASWRLNALCFALSPVALAIVFWYSLAKRYTTWTQLFLGLAVAVAPVGGWLAVGGRGGWEPWLLALAIGTWVGGFDVLDACQDLEFDRAHGLRSIPVRFGVPASLAISRLMHVVAIVCLMALGFIVPLGAMYFGGVAIVAALLVYEQSLVRADDLSQVKRAFDLNGYVGILYLIVLAVSLSMAADARPAVALAITGASGALYATRTLAALLERGVHVELIVSDYGRRLLRDELGDAAVIEQILPFLSGKYGSGVAGGSINLHSNRDLGATIASGSHGCSGMAIVPCSMKTLAAIAHGLSRSLIERAADVMLKEKRRLVIVPRETPMSLPQLRNMVLCAEAGAMILPAMPAFYQLPKTLDDLADFMAGKVLSALGFEHQLYPPWTGRAGQQ